MNQNRIRTSRVRPEVTVTTARSGGPGGQHVNKVETKVILRFNVPNSQVLSASEKEVILTRLKNKLSKEGDLIVTADTQRSQTKNKEIAFKKMDRLFAKAFTIKKERRTTKPSRAAIDKRIKEKKLQSEKKKMRQKLR